MKATLRFNLPEDALDFVMASRGKDCFMALDRISDELFRPARKNGYSDVSFQELIDKIGDDAYELIHYLERRFNEILADEKIDLQ
jgi:hypothetical protein